MKNKGILIFLVVICGVIFLTCLFNKSNEYAIPEGLTIPVFQEEFEEEISLLSKFSKQKTLSYPNPLEDQIKSLFQENRRGILEVTVQTEMDNESYCRLITNRNIVSSNSFGIGTQYSNNNLTSNASLSVWKSKDDKGDIFKTLQLNGLLKDNNKEFSLVFDLNEISEYIKGKA